MPSILAGMAALPDYLSPEVVDLRSLSAADLAPVFAEEAQVWWQDYEWDFAPVAEQLNLHLEARQLPGCALRLHDGIIGYTYCVIEEDKGMVGGLFIVKAYCTRENERLLLRATIDMLRQNPYLHRVESQLMLMRHAPAIPRFSADFPYARYVHTFERVLMEVDPRSAPRTEWRTAHVLADRWQDRLLDEASRVVTQAYRGHVDSQINDQYRTVGGSRRFLNNLLNFPGCGRFQPSSSKVALDARNGELRGLVLTSLISPRIGHITQICTLPAARGQGTGRLLLGQALEALAAAGCEKVTLTVTLRNEAAIGLYHSFGFTATRKFAAHVWDGF